MKAKKKKKLILSLIKDDLINSKLVTSLCNAGLFAEDYYLHLSETIFELLGYQEDHYSDQVFEQYQHLANRIQHISLAKTHQLVDPLALELYEFLVEKAPSG